MANKMSTVVVAVRVQMITDAAATLVKQAWCCIYYLTLVAAGWRVRVEIYPAFWLNRVISCDVASARIMIMAKKTRLRYSSRLPYKPSMRLSSQSDVK
jgi:hypothetical protein